MPVFFNYRIAIRPLTLFNQCEERSLGIFLYIHFPIFVTIIKVVHFTDESVKSDLDFLLDAAANLYCLIPNG